MSIHKYVHLYIHTYIHIYIYMYIYIYILTPPAQAADITGLLSYLRPFGIVPLPHFPSKLFAPLSLLRSIPPFPPKALSPSEIFSLFLIFPP